MKGLLVLAGLGALVAGGVALAHAKDKESGPKLTVVWDPNGQRYVYAEVRPDGLYPRPDLPPPPVDAWPKG